MTNSQRDALSLVNTDRLVLSSVDDDYQHSAQEGGREEGRKEGRKERRKETMIRARPTRVPVVASSFPKKETSCL